MNKKYIYGNRNFDKKYYGIYYKNYDHNELNKAYKWFKGWIRIINWLYPLKKFYGSNVLVVGSGIGAFPKAIKEAGFNVYATDTSSFIISKASKLQNGIKFGVENFKKNKEKDSKYQIIFVIKTLERLKNPKDALKNLKSRLNKDGVIIFVSPFPSRGNLKDPTHINIKTPQEWLKMGRELGFKKVQFRYVSFLPFLYRYHSFFSRAIPIKLDSPLIVSTCLFSFEN